MIDTNKLRISVLRLAFEGKLTKQFESDGNAADLLKRISPDKNIIQSEGIPYSIPATWCWAKLSDVYVLNPKVTAENTLDSAFIPMEKISDGFSDKFTYEIQSWEKASKNHTKFADGDVAFAKISPCFENRKSFIAHDLPNGIGGGTTELIILRQKEMDCEYTYYLVSDERFIYAGSDSYRGIVGQQRVKPDIVKNYLIPVAPYAEQKRIVEKITSAFELIDIIDKAQNEYSSNLDALKKKVIEEGIKGNLTKQNPTEDGTVAELLKEIEAEKQELIKAGKLKKEKPLPEITEEEKPFEIPENWKWVRITDIAKCELGKTKDSCKNTGEYYDYLCSINVYDGSIDLSNVKQMKFEPDEFERFTVKKGDLLICEGGDAGRCAVWDKDFTMFYQNALHRIRFYKNINPYYYMYLMHIYKANNVLSSASTGVTIQHFTMNSLKKLCFPLPPLAEQRRIVEKIDEVLALIA